METNSEGTIIPIVQLENFKLLPLNTQKLINDLSKDLKVSGLTVFNPLVEAMTQIEAYRKLKYIKDDNECIGEFKLAKNTIRSFRASTTKAKKKLKAPLLKTGKDIDAIESAFKDAATDILENYLEKEFKPYLDEEEAKKLDKEAKKNKATTDKINELSDETIQQQLIITRMNVKSRLDKEVFLLSKTISDKIANYSKQALISEYNALGTLKLVLSEEDKNTLLPEQITELEESYQTVIDNSKLMIDMRVQAFDNVSPVVDTPIASQNEINQINVNEYKDVNNIDLKQGLEVFDVNEFLAPSISEDDPEYFKVNVEDILTDTIESISDIKTKSALEDSVKSKLIESLSGIQEKVAQFLS